VGWASARATGTSFLSHAAATLAEFEVPWRKSATSLRSCRASRRTSSSRCLRGEAELPAFKKRERDRRFAVSRWLSGGDSNRRHGSADRWRRRKLLSGVFWNDRVEISRATSVSRMYGAQKRTGSSNPLRSTNESVRTAGPFSIHPTYKTQIFSWFTEGFDTAASWTPSFA
jgi:hypothetical protein